MPSRLCNWIPGAHSKPPLSQDPNSVCFCVCHVECTTISLLRLLHVSRRKAWEWPLAHMAGHPLQEDLLALCPLTLGWWLYHLPAARGFSSLPLSMGRGEGSTSLAPHLPLEAQAVLGLGTVYLICMHAARCGGDRKGPAITCGCEGSCRKGICS